MKNIFKTAFLILSMVLCPLFLSSCDDDKEEDEREDRVKTVEKDGIDTSIVVKATDEIDVTDLKKVGIPR